MSHEYNLEDVGREVVDLRREIERKTPDREKINRLNRVLDQAETKSQEITRVALLAQNHEAEIKQLKRELEAAGAEAGKVREQVDAMELHLARVRGAVDPESKAWKAGAEFKALTEYCRHGMQGVAHGDVEVKALRTDSSVEGGFLVPQEMDAQILRRITEVDPIRSVARVRTTAAKSIDVPVRNTIPAATYEGEGDQGGESQGSYQSETLTPFRQTFTTPVTMDLLQTANFDMESEMAADAAQAFAFGEGSGFVLGTGFKQPSGFMVNATLQAAARLTGVSGQLTPNSIILLTGDLKVGYSPVYVLNRRTLALIRTFRGDAASPGDGQGQFLWMPGLNGPVSNTLNGFPYILANSVPDVAAGAYAMAFGDFRIGYTIVDRTGLAVVRDEVTSKRRAIVEFTWHRWNTGQVVLAEAIKLLRITP